MKNPKKDPDFSEKLIFVAILIVFAFLIVAALNFK